MQTDKEKIDEDVNLFFKFLKDNYSGDHKLIEKFETVFQKYLGMEHTNLSHDLEDMVVDDPKKIQKEKKVKSEEEIERKLISSLNKEKSTKPTNKFSTTEECILSIKKLEADINNKARKQLILYSLMRKSFHIIKLKEKANFFNTLKTHSIEYKKEYINFLIQFHHTMEKYPTMYYSSLPIRFFRNNIKKIPEIAIKNSW